MAQHDLDAIFYVTKAPAIEFRDGNFHVCYDIGRRGRFEVVMPPKAFLQARLAGSELIAKWQLEGMPDDNVFGIGKRKPHTDA